MAAAFSFASAQQPLRQPSARRFGARLTAASRYQAIPVAMTPVTRTLPATVDLSGYMPPVGNQGNQDSCAAWSTVYAVRTYLERAEMQQWNVNSPAAEFSPSFLYNQVARGNCTTGIAIPDALNILAAQGASTLATMPYVETDCQTQPSQQVIQYASQYRISGYRRVNQQDLSTVKAHLAAGFPVLLAVDTDATFLALGRNQVWTTKGPSEGTHAIVLVGYNDAQHAMKFINSWGTDWGTDGYGFLDYNLLPAVAFEAYVVLPFHSHQTSPAALESNVQIQSVAVVTGPIPGFNVQVEYTLRGYASHTGQIALYFWYQNGQQVQTTSAGFGDINGNAVVATPTFTVQQNDYTNYTFTQFVPASILNVPAGGNVVSGGQLLYQPLMTTLLMNAELFVDNYGLAQSQYYSFSVSR
jgi:hypothetical protein